MGAEVSNCCRSDHKERHDVDGAAQALQDMPLFIDVQHDADLEADLSTGHELLHTGEHASPTLTEDIMESATLKLDNSEYEAVVVKVSEGTTQDAEVDVLDQQNADSASVGLSEHKQHVPEDKAMQKHQRAVEMRSKAKSKGKVKSEGKAHGIRKKHEGEQSISATCYKGHFSHKQFGSDPIDIAVRITSGSKGSWSAFGKSKDIAVVWQDDHAVFDDGMTKFDGRRDSSGNLSGDVFQEGVVGGSFVLKLEQEVVADSRASERPHRSNARANTKSAGKHEAGKLSSSSYYGHFSHPAFHGRDINITVHITGATIGSWEALGAQKAISVTHQGQHVIFDDGMTRFDGVQDAKGNLTGDVFQEGAPGGSFSMSPKKQKKAKGKES